MEQKNKSPVWKGKSSEPNLHDFGFQPLIFRDVHPKVSTRQDGSRVVVAKVGALVDGVALKKSVDTWRKLLGRVTG